VKPQNLLVRADGTLKVSDFGIAFSTEATRITTDGTILGTATYLAPEQVMGEQVGAAVDVYGLGAVLHEALTGRPPIEVQSLAVRAGSRPGSGRSGPAACRRRATGAGPGGLATRALGGLADN
jgi:serine/threonine protein kinase